MQDEIVKTEPHNLILEDRKKLRMTGVTDVDSFDESTVLAYTCAGELTIEGNIVSLTYIDQAPKSTGFFGKMFR